MPDLLSYQGNANLGAGSNPGANVPLGPNDNLKIINDTGRDIMLLDAERNMKIFQQRVADRDNLSKLILNNQVSAGEIDPKYHKEFDDAQDNSVKAFTKWGGNFNDKEGYRKYQESITHLQDVATHAQTNTIELKKLIQQRASETLPWKQEALDKHIEAQKNKDFWGHVDPYQQMFSFSIDPILKLYKTSTATSYSKDGLFRYDDTIGDYAGTLKAAQNELLNHAEASEDMREFLGKVDEYQPQLKKQFIDALNSQLAKYNQERGLQQGSIGFADPIQLVTGPDNQLHINADPASFSAKYALANQEKYSTRASSFNKDFANYEINKDKLALAAKKLGIDADKAKAYIANLNAKTKKYFQDNKAEATNVEHMYQGFVDNIKPGGIAEFDRKTKKQTGTIDAIFLNELPESYQYIGGPISAVKTTTDKSGKTTSIPTGKITVGKLEPFKAKDGRAYYIPKYVNPQTGDKITLDSGELKSNYNASKKAGFGGSYDDYIRTLLKKGGLEMILQGQNGTANYTSMFQSAKVLNNEGSKKGQENVENAPNDDTTDADITPEP